MTTRCVDVVPLLGPLLDGALPSDDREWVEDHLLGCGKCGDRKSLIAAQGQAIREVIGARAAAASFQGFTDRVLARVSSEPPPEAPGRLGAMNGRRCFWYVPRSFMNLITPMASE